MVETNICALAKPRKLSVRAQGKICLTAVSLEWDTLTVIDLTEGDSVRNNRTSLFSLHTYTFCW